MALRAAWLGKLTRRSSSLRFAQLDGVFVSITPGDPSLWVGVIFVRKGTCPQRKAFRASPGCIGATLTLPLNHMQRDDALFLGLALYSHLHRSICPCNSALSDILSGQLSYTASPRDLLDRRLPPAAHTTHNVHVHNWIVRHRYRQCDRRGETASGRV